MDMEKDKRVFGFEIWDNDYFENNSQFMLYTIKNNYLKPVLKKFELGWDELFDFSNVLKCLKYNNVNRLYTYHPTIDETLCSAPYELNTEEELNGCEFDGKWNRFYHLEIFLSGEKIDSMKKNNIKLIHLNNGDVKDLEKKLKLHY